MTYKLTEEQRKQLVNYLAKQPYMQVATLVTMLVSLSPIKDVPNLAKAYINAQRLIGTDKIPLPANPTDEDLDRIYGKLGRPADANGYDIAVDGHIVTEDVAKNFSDIAHKLRLNPEQASGIMQYYKSAVENSSQDFEQQNKETAEETQASLKKEWGKAYDQKIEQASKVAKDFASSDLLKIVNTIPGVSAVNDNFEVGVQERVVVLNNRGRALGFSISEIGSQIRTAINGKIVCVISNNVVMLSEIAVIKNKIPFSSISRQDGFREVTISGDLNSSIVNTTQARNFLLENGLVELAKKYNLDYRFAGRDLEQKETFADMFIGSIIGLIIIYIVLTWVFKSWLRPFTIMIMIPLSFIGAVFGHYFLNLTMSILSMFALLALAGIVVNNSIILVSTIERRLDELIKGNTINLEIFKQAVISGVINRLRPVLLTSLTTIGGLSALMFEKSLQAQFLIPMAATIVFGLGITAILVLVVIPSMMGIGKDLSLLIKGSKIN